MPDHGCGAVGSSLDPPELRFGAACNLHDMDYARGGTSADRAGADLRFLHNMLERARCAPWHKRLYLVPFAYAYYASVRVAGHKSFRFK